MSDDYFFTAQQKGVIRMIVAELVAEARQQLSEEIKGLRSEIDDLKTDRIRQERLLREKDHFTVKDLAELLHVKPETVRKNYIHTGLIEAESISGKPSVISKEEYWRVDGDLKKYGKVTPKRSK